MSDFISFMEHKLMIKVHLALTNMICGCKRSYFFKHKENQLNNQNNYSSPQYVFYKYII